MVISYFYILILYKNNVFQLFQDYVPEDEDEEKDQQEQQDEA